MGQPYVAQKPIVTLLVQDQLTVASETWVNFAMAVEVWRKVPRAVAVVEIQNGALANVDEQADVLTAPM